MVTELGIEIRCGVHTGIVEVLENDVSGVAVNIGARITALAGPSEVLVSRTVRDLIAGTDITLEDRGDHHLKGIADSWRIYAVVHS